MKTLEELDCQQTPLGELILRRRISPSVPGEPVYEVTLDDEMLMSSPSTRAKRRWPVWRSRVSETARVTCSSVA